MGIGIAPSVIFYNTEIFNKLNLEVPATWEELDAVCASLKDAGYVPFALGNKNKWPGLLEYTCLLYTSGNVPNLMVKVPEQNEFYLGELFYFFEFACGVSGYILGVNPFNQPGVESYKKNMFALLGMI